MMATYNKRPKESPFMNCTAIMHLPQAKDEINSNWRLTAK
jgi:hypothetical protein